MVDKFTQNEYIQVNQKEGNSMTESEKKQEREEALAMAKAWRESLERDRILQRGKDE